MIAEETSPSPRTDAPRSRVAAPPRLRVLAAAGALLAAACGTAAHAAPPATPAPAPRVKKVMTADGAWPAIVAARRGHLGVELLDLTPELREHFGAPRDAGVMVARLIPGGPAAKAGLRVGDLITAVDGKKVGDDADLRRQIREKKDKEVASLEVLRDRARQTIKATVEERETRELDLSMLQGPRARQIELDPERIQQLVDRAMRNVHLPDVQERLERRREIEEKLQQRTQALEQRLERLERELSERKK